MAHPSEQSNARFLQALEAILFITPHDNPADLVSQREATQLLSDPSITKTDQIFVTQLIRLHEKTSQKELLSFIKTYIKESATNNDKPSANTIRLRRTALALYETLDHSQYTSQFIENLIPQISSLENWDGNVSVFTTSLMAILREKPSGNIREAPVSISEAADILNQIKTLSFTDAYFLENITHITAQTSQAEVLDIVTRFLNSTIQQTEEPTTLTIRLRKTALVLYQVLNVTEPSTTASGGLKSVLIPKGQQTQYSDVGIEKLLARIGNIRDWNGRFDNSEIQAAKTKYVTVIPDRRQDQEMVVSKEILEEFKLIQDLRSKVANPECLPNPKIFGNKKVRNEYVPFEYETENEKELLQVALSLLDTLEDLWKNGNIINTDLKPENIRLRNTGQVVLFDWGGCINLSPGQTRLQIPQAPMQFSHTSLAPEWEASMLRSQEFDIEKQLVFDVGRMLLMDVYGKGPVSAALTARKGHKWFYVDIYGYSINENTYAEVSKNPPIHPTRDEILILIKRLVNDNPRTRPTIAELRAELQGYLAQHN